jgi:hypothetical protein
MSVVRLSECSMAQARVLRALLAGAEAALSQVAASSSVSSPERPEPSAGHSMVERRSPVERSLSATAAEVVEQ